MKRLTTLLATMLMLCGCAATAAPQASVHHIVLIKLDDADQAEALIDDCDELARSVEGIESWFVGSPMDRQRPEVDSDYDVGLYLRFASLEAYEAYLEDPQHQRILAKWGPHLRWLRIHDVAEAGRSR